MTVLINVVVPIAFVTVVVVWSVLSEWPGRWEKPLRDEMRARPETFHAYVSMPRMGGGFRLSVHGDLFEVARTRVPVIGFLNGPRYCYRAQDTTIETSHGWQHDWIDIRGLPGTGAVPVRICWYANRQLWDALVNAGAQPIGPPPAR